MGFVVAGATFTGDVLVRNAGGDLLDPDAGTLNLHIVDPDGVTQVTVAAAGITRVSAGTYRYLWAVPADADTGSWQFRWDADLEGADLPDSVETVIVLPVGSLGSTFVSVANVRAIVSTELTDDQLSGVILREEEELASVVGPLGGPRTETFYPEARQPLYLQRPTGSVVVTDVGAVVPDTTILLTGGGTRLTRYRSAQTSVAGSYWIGPVTVTYTPNDAARVTRVVIELCRLTLTETGFEAESIGDYSYSNRGSGTSTESRRRRLMASLKVSKGPRTVRVDGPTARPPVWVANVGWGQDQ